MTELIEKMSYEERKDNILIKPFTLEDVAKEVELAFKAGMLHFNALDHTLKPTGNSQYMTTWSSAEDLERKMCIGDFSLLPSLYLQAKGFKK